MAKHKDPNAIPLPPMPEVQVSKGNAIDLPPLPDVGVTSGGSDGSESVKDLLRDVIRLLEDIRDNTEDIGGGESLG